MKTSDKMRYGTGIALALVIGACAKQKPHLGESSSSMKSDGVSITQHESRSLLPSGGLAGEESTVAEVEAVVKGIDVSKRILKLSVSGGEAQSYKVSEDVRNFEQVKPGDRIKVRYTQTVAFEVREPTAEERKLGSVAIGGLDRSPKGSLPGGSVVNAGITVVTIQSVDKSKQELTVQTEDGRSVTLKARYPENLALAKQGQKVVITYAESLVAGVERIQ